MPRALSNDLRERVLARYETEGSIRKVAAIFGLAPSTVLKWVQRRRETGSVAPKKIGGYRRPVLEPHQAWIESRFQQTPELTLKGLQTELAARGIQASYGAVQSFVKSIGLSLKKTAFAREQDRPDAARYRKRWQARQEGVDPRRLVFLDETWVKTNMAPLRGWGARGRRLIAKSPRGRWRTLTFLAALRVDRIEAPCVFDVPVNGERFRAYVEQFLVRTLQPGDIVVLDNLGGHKGKAVRQAIRTASAHRFFLPPYSPDLNPLEQVFARECAAYFRNSGYASN